jgi:hypothetical protein
MEIVMARFLDCALVSLGFPLAANAAPDIVDPAPAFATQTAPGATVYNFSLAESSRGHR